MKKGIIFVFLIAISGLAYYVYISIFGVNINAQEGEFLFLKNGISHSQMDSILVHDKFIIDLKSYQLTSRLMRYTNKKPYPGRYNLSKIRTNVELIRLLRSGKQDPVKVIINNERHLPDICGKATKNIEADSLELLSILTSKDFLEKHKFTRENVVSLFIPNTYYIYWNTSSRKLTERLISENEKFWMSKNRPAKLKLLNMNKQEVYTLASIIEKESNKKDERRRIAGVYLNRIKKGIPLQADPTVVYAVGDFTIKRVLNKHTQIDSPYNTYINLGLPPGPICIPSINSIDAVLDAEKHNYYYFCAKADYSGYHSFAKTLAGHNANAQRYRRWLTKQGF